MIRYVDMHNENMIQNFFDKNYKADFFDFLFNFQKTILLLSKKFLYSILQQLFVFNIHFTVIFSSAINFIKTDNTFKSTKITSAHLPDLAF